MTSSPPSSTATRRRLDEQEHIKNVCPGMDERDILAFYPFVVVRIACRQCSRAGSYRLARLAAKMGPESTLDEVLRRFSYDCMWRQESRNKATLKAQSCGVFFPDLDQPRPPDLPPGLMKLRLVQGGKG